MEITKSRVMGSSWSVWSGDGQVLASWYIDGHRNNAIGLLECSRCDGVRWFYGSQTSIFNESCPHLHTTYLEENFNLYHWMRIQDERLGTEFRRCIHCKETRELRYMKVYEDKDNAGQPIWECFYHALDKMRQLKNAS